MEIKLELGCDTRHEDSSPTQSDIAYTDRAWILILSHLGHCCVPDITHVLAIYLTVASQVGEIRLTRIEWGRLWAEIRRVHIPWFAPLISLDDSYLLLLSYQLSIRALPFPIYIGMSSHFMFPFLPCS
jgi:hypothetical protein